MGGTPASRCRVILTPIATLGLAIALALTASPRAIAQTVFAGGDLADLRAISPTLTFSHQRTDFPARDDKRFLAHSLIYRKPDGSCRVEYLPVTITRWPPAERIYGK